jgi:hypothetical protein
VQNLEPIVRSFFEFSPEGAQWWNRHGEAGKYGTDNKSFKIVSRLLESALPPAIRF